MPAACLCFHPLKDAWQFTHLGTMLVHHTTARPLMRQALLLPGLPSLGVLPRALPACLRRLCCKVLPVASHGQNLAVPFGPGALILPGPCTQVMPLPRCLMRAHLTWLLPLRAS